MILPEGESFSNLESTIIYEDDPESDILAEVRYSLDGQYAGNCNLILNDPVSVTDDVEEILASGSVEQKVTYIDVTRFIPYVAVSLAGIAVIALIIHLMKTYNFGNAMNRRREIRKRQKRYHSDFDDIDF